MVHHEFSRMRKVCCDGKTRGSPTRSLPGLSGHPDNGHCAILIEIAGSSLVKPGDDATIFIPVTVCRNVYSRQDGTGSSWKSSKLQLHVSLRLCTFARVAAGAFLFFNFS